MKVKSLSSRHVRLSLSDFEMDPTELAATLAARDVFVRRKGEPSKVTGRPAQRSSVTICYGFQGGRSWNEALEGLIASIGGLVEVRQLLVRVAAKDQHIHFQIPVRSSPLQENNFLDHDMIELLRNLKLWVGFDFSDFDQGDPTHLDSGI